MKKNSLVLALLMCFCVNAVAQYFVPPTYFGINHWMPKKYLYNTSIPNGRIETSGIQQMVKQMGANVYRIGGNGYDKYGTAIGVDSSRNDYIRAIQIIKGSNPSAKFLIQVPYDCGTFTADSASKLVTNLKTAFPFDKFYYAVGNEWDRYRHPNTKKFLMNEISTPIKAFALKMKTADSSIKIVAPALSYLTATDSLGYKIMDTLLKPTGPNSIVKVITGTGNPQLDNIKYYVDVIDFHTYGGGADLSSATASLAFNTARSNLISYAGTSGGFVGELNSLNTMLNTANATRTGSKLTYAITEMNVCYKNQPTPSTGNKYTNVAEGISARSFYAGQFFANMMGTLLEKGSNPSNPRVEYIMPWSIHESGGDGSAFDLSITKGAATSGPPTPLSSLHHYSLMAQHFLGRYYPSTTNNMSPNVRAFASVEDSAGIYVMILNHDSVAHDYNLDLASNSPTGSSLLLGFSVANTVLPLDSISNFNDTIDGNTTILVLYNCHGRKLWKIKYSLTDAISDGNPHFKQIGEHDVDPDALGCEIGMFEGNQTSDVAFLNQTVWVTGDVNLSGVKLTFDKCVVIVSSGMQIHGDPYSSLEIKNGTVIYGCEGPWKGIFMEGNSDPSETVLIENSFIYNAETPIYCGQMTETVIKRNIMANGDNAIFLKGCNSFTIEGNVLGCYNTGVYTSGTPNGYYSTIKQNQIIHSDRAMIFDGDDHSTLDLSCNTMGFFSEGIRSNCTLNDIGNSSVSGGNVFFKLGSYGLPPSDWINHSGGSPTYYAGPLETTLIGASTPINISMGSATVDGTCAISVLANWTCKNLTAIGIKEQEKDKTDLITVFPNPSSGTFNLTSKDSKGIYTLTVFDAIGRMIMSKKVDFTSEKTVSFEIKTQGIYLVTLNSNSERITKKVIVE
jgi:hypothetical protein